MINPTEVTFYSPETVEALTFIQDSSSKYHFAPDGTDNSYMSGWFASGVCTFHISGVYDIVYMTGIEDFEWDIAPLPNTMNTKGDTAVLYAGYAVSSQTENPELAKEFVSVADQRRSTDDSGQHRHFHPGQQGRRSGRRNAQYSGRA